MESEVSEAGVWCSSSIGVAAEDLVRLVKESDWVASSSSSMSIRAENLLLLKSVEEEAEELRLDGFFEGFVVEGLAAGFLSRLGGWLGGVGVGWGGWELPGWEAMLGANF